MQHLITIRSLSCLLSGHSVLGSHWRLSRPASSSLLLVQGQRQQWISSSIKWKKQRYWQNNEKNEHFKEFNSLFQLISHKKTQEASELYQKLKPSITASSMAKTLSLCTKAKLSEMGKEVFKDAVDLGFDKDIKVLSAGVRLFGSIGQLSESKRLFELALSVGPSVFTYNAWIQCLLDADKTNEAIEVYKSMKERDAVTFTAMLTACSKHKLKELGIEICEQIAKSGLRNDVILCTSMIGFYSNAGMVAEAQKSFETALKLDPSVKTYNAWLRCLIEANETSKAIDLFNEMKHRDAVTFTLMISLCSTHKLRELGKQIARSIPSDFSKDIKLLTSLIGFFGSAGMLKEAQKSFDFAVTLETDIGVYNAYLKCLIESNKVKKAVEVYHRMQYRNSITFVTMLGLCAKQRLKALGQEVYQKAISSGFATSSVLSTAITFFSNVDMLEDAGKCFELALKSGADINTHNSWLQSLCDWGEIEKAIQLFESMKFQNSTTFVIVLAMCSKYGLKEIGEKVYQQAITSGFGNDIHFLTTAISFFGNVGMLDEAQKSFEFALKSGANVATFNSWLQCLSDLNQKEQAIELFRSMQVRDSTTLLIVLGMCSKYKLKEFGQEVYQIAITYGFGNDIRVLTTAISFFGNVGMLKEAEKIFKLALNSGANVVTFNTWLRCLSDLNEKERAIETFQSMKEFDSVTFVIMLAMCSKYGLKEFGEEVYHRGIKYQCETDVQFMNTAITFFGNVGMLKQATKIFNSMEVWDPVTFCTMLSMCSRNSLVGLTRKIYNIAADAGLHKDPGVFSEAISAFANSGQMDRAIELYQEGLANKIPMSSQIFGSLVSACARNGKLKEAEDFLKQGASRSLIDDNAITPLIYGYARCGMVNEAIALFNRMESDFGLKKSVDIYASILEVLARAGMLNECAELLSKVEIQFGVNKLCLIIVMEACRKFHNVTLAENLFAKGLSQLNNTAFLSIMFHLLAGIYEDTGASKKAEIVREERHVRQLWDLQGVSKIMIGKKKYTFGASPPHKSSLVFEKLAELEQELFLDGFHMTKFDRLTSQVIADEKHRKGLCSHSEKQAIALGLASLPAEADIEITKNLPVCQICHEAAARLSRIHNRKIIMKDSKKEHHFKNGRCSCNNFW